MLTLLTFTVVLTFLIVIHEWGHLIAAQLNGIKVFIFSIGFGPKLISKKIGETEYAVSVIPLGGYVKMAGENTDVVSNASDEFASKTLWQKALVVLAGPSMNIFLALILVPLAYLIGTREPVYLNKPAKIGWVEEGSLAQKAGIQAGDVIISFNRQVIDSWRKFMNQTGSPVKSDIRVIRRDEIMTFQLTNLSNSAPGPGLLGVEPEVLPVVRKVFAGTPAEKAGLLKGDKIISVNGVPVTHMNHFFHLVKNSIGIEIQLMVDRKGILVTFPLTPVDDEKVKNTATGIAMVPETDLKQYGLLVSIQKGYKDLVNSMVLTFDVLKRLTTFHVSSDSLGGPINIVQATGQAAQVGFGTFISFVATMSLQLGIFNLLPIPVLDGGWLLFLVIEAFTGRPVPLKFVRRAQSFGLAVLITFIFLVSYLDILRLIQ